MNPRRAPWSNLQEVPAHAAAQLAEYCHLFGRDPRVVEGAFLEAANSLDLIRESVTSAQDSRLVGDLLEARVSNDRVAAGWAALHKFFPSEKRKWAKHSLEHSRAQQEAEQVHDGDALFKEVVRVIRSHYYFEKDWHYTICALFVMQSWVTRAGGLPAVFYLFFGGPMSSGKTGILYHLSSLTDGIMLENVSAPALARLIGDGRTILLDEFDVRRGEELDDVIASLVRSGYRRNGPAYTRWNAKEKMAEELSIFGPKAGTFRSALDPAVQSRGFVIPTSKPVGEEHYGLILASWWPKTGEIRERLREWGRWAHSAWPPDKLEERARSPPFQAKLRTVVGQIGANRESELLTLALLVAEMVPFDVVESLSSARELRTVEVSEDQADALDELRTAVLDVLAKTVSFAAGGKAVFRVVQRDVRNHLNFARKSRGDRPVSSGRMALLRRELGVSDSWLVESGHKVVWNLPPEFVDLLKKQSADTTPAGPLGPDTPPAGGSPPPPYLPSGSLTPFRLPPGSPDDRREQGSHKGVPGGGGVPEGSTSTGAGPGLPEDIDPGRGTKADRARSAWERNHEGEGE